MYGLEQFLKSGNRFSDKNCGKNKGLEHYVEPREAKNALAHRWRIYLIGLLTGLGVSSNLWAHPHIFIDARVHISVDAQNKVTSLSQDWHFDPLFSTTVILDFDLNGNRQLDPPEIATLNQTIRQSLAEFDFFQSITANGRTISLAEPDKLETYIKNNELYLTLENRPLTPLKLEPGGHYYFTLYDPTFYVAVDFNRDIDVTLTGLPNFCSSRMIRPDGENMLSQSLAELSESLSQRDESFFDDPQASLDLARELAPKLEVTCSKSAGTPYLP